MFQENLNAGFNDRTPHLFAAAGAGLALFSGATAHPDVMRFVAEDRPLAAIREAFDSRLAPWAPGSAHWLCLVVRDAASRLRWASRVYSSGGGLRRSRFFSHPRRRGKVTALNPCRRFAITPSSGRYTSAHRHRHGGKYRVKRLLEKARFRLEELRESYYLGGRWQNDWLFGLLKHEYLNNNS
jgi:hypothetical protein